jgi:hypothetical protein
MAVLLAVLLPVTLLAFNVGRVIFSPDIVKQAAAEAIVESDIVVEGLRWYAEGQAEEREQEQADTPAQQQEPDVLLLLSYIDPDSWTAIRDEVLPDEIIIAWMEHVVDATYAWIDSEDPLPQVRLDMRDFKARVGGEHGTQALMIAYEALPSCTETDVADFLSRLSAAPAGTEVLFNPCKFPEPWVDTQIAEYQSTLDQVVREIADEYRLVDRLNEDNVNVIDTPAETAKSILVLIRFAMRWSVILPLVLALLVLAVAAPYRRRGLWPGLPLIIGGVLALLIIGVHRWAITRAMVAIPLGTLTFRLIEEGEFFLLKLAGESFSFMTITALIAMAVGVVCIIAVRPAERGVEIADDEQDITTSREVITAQHRQARAAMDTLTSPTPPARPTDRQEPPSPPDKG